MLEGKLCLLEVLEVMHVVLLGRLEAVEVEYCFHCSSFLVTYSPLSKAVNPTTGCVGFPLSVWRPPFRGNIYVRLLLQCPLYGPHACPISPSRPARLTGLVHSVHTVEPEPHRKGAGKVKRIDANFSAAAVPLPCSGPDPACRNQRPPSPVGPHGLCHGRLRLRRISVFERQLRPSTTTFNNRIG